MATLMGALLREIAAALAAGEAGDDKDHADHLARQGRAAFVTATHTLRGNSGKESPGDKSFIPAKGIKLTKIGERSNSNVAYAGERDTPACSVTRFCGAMLALRAWRRPPSS